MHLCSSRKLPLFPRKYGDGGGLSFTVKVNVYGKTGIKSTGGDTTSTGATTLIAKANPETLDYNTATTDQKNQMWAFPHEAINEGIDIENEKTNKQNAFLTERQTGRLISEIGIQEAGEKLKELIIDASDSQQNTIQEEKN